MNSTRLLFAFSVGMAAAINPCGFALLPAYLSYYLGLESGQTRSDADTATVADTESNPALAAVWVSASMTAGFVLVFGLIGLVWSSISSTIGSKLPWVTFGVGIVLVAVGIAMLSGYTPVVRGPKLRTTAGTQSARSVFVFGVTYAVASLSCTIGLFAAVVLQSFEQDSFAAGVAVLVAYALGMGALITILTVAVTFAQQGVIGRMKGMLAHMGRISGALMVASGIVAAYYGWYEAQLLDTAGEVSGPGDTLARWQANISGWITEVGAGRIGVAIAVVVAAAIAVGYVRRGPKAARQQP